MQPPPINTAITPDPAHLVPTPWAAWFNQVAVRSASSGGGTGGGTPPIQPTDMQWIAAVVRDDHDPQTGLNTALCHVLVGLSTADPAITDYYVWTYKGDTPPTDNNQWEYQNGAAKAESGDNTEIFWRISREIGSTGTYWVIVVASTATYSAGPADFTGTPKSITVDAVHIPPQVTGFGVSASGPVVIAGSPYAKLTDNFNVPNDPEIQYINIYRFRAADGSYTPIAGPEGALVLIASILVDPSWYGNAVSWMQPDYWQWLDGESWWGFEARTWSRAAGENTTSAPTYNLHMAASPGLTLTTLSASSWAAVLGPGLQFSSGKATVNVNGTTLRLDPATSQLYIDGMPADKLYAGTTIGAGVVFAGVLAAGVVYAGQVNVGQLTAGGAAFSGDVVLTRATNYLYGTCATSGTSVAWTSGANFSTLYAGAVIQIDGTNYTIASVNSSTSLTLTSSAPTGSYSFVAYTGPVLTLSAAAITLSNAAANAPGISITSTQITFGTASTYSAALKNYSSAGIEISTNSGTIYLHGASGVAIMNGQNLNITPGRVKAYAFETNQVSGNWTINGGLLASIQLAGATIIDATGAFVGAGVACKTNGIGGSGFNYWNVARNAWDYGMTANNGTDGLYAQVWIPAIPGTSFTGQWAWVYWGPYLQMSHAALQVHGGVITGFIG